jgi:small subunit ribosomal protein S4
LARYIGPVCKLCRREGDKLFLKGDRCSSSKCAINKKSLPPGQHGISRKKMSEYGLQLRAKQKTKRIYGILEKQFRNYFKKANKNSGSTGEVLLSLLEHRLDNVIYRMGFARSRREARQVVRHNHVKVNNKKNNIPSCIIKIGDIIEIKEQIQRFKDILSSTEARIVPDWLDVDRENLKGKVVSNVRREQIDSLINETLIIELYSK